MASISFFETQNLFSKHFPIIQSEYLPHVTKKIQKKEVYVGDLNLVTLKWGIP
jgi:hypothetical protein